MTNVLDGLLAKIEDPDIRSEIIKEVGRLRDTKQFGLVFERHLPETTKLFNHPVRRGARVQRRGRGEQRSGVVVAVSNGLASIAWEDDETEDIATSELVVVARVGDPIYPGLTSIGRVERGGNKPFHTVINAENHHALQMLQFTHQGKVDVIYIDPPYNTGAKDWKYNNSFVDKTDTYRHSKWLSFMERRLLLARHLLKPDGVLVVTIDENEQHHLMMIMEQVYPERELTPVVVQHNPRGIQGDNFSMTHEVAVFVTPRGKTALSPQPITDESDSATLRNWGGESDRTDAKNCFYPIYVKDGSVVGFGDVLPDDEHPSAANEEQDDGSIAVWPIDKNGNEKKWRYARQSVEDIKHLLRPKLVTQGPRKGILDIEKSNDARPFRSVWVDSRYDASTHGTQLVSAFTGTSFPFPKSIYSVYDVLYAAAAHKPNAVILDFFAGSGTTAHASFLLNTLDGGTRSSILVTNNEVGAKQAASLVKSGHLPGSDEYEAWGIAKSVTWPRVMAAVSGSVDGEELPTTTYLGGDSRSWSMGFDENVEFFELTYQSSDRVARGRAYDAVAPLLWLAAGGVGPRIDKSRTGFAAPAGSRYAVLFDPVHVRDLVAALEGRNEVETVYVVTDSTAFYQQAAAELPTRISAVRLYEAYLRNFEIDSGGDL